ncbi:MAG: hypothetical protein EOQ46_26125 [Mesorhizobium sp.]|uniref:hypothetical protein n=1 Tax=Mesorhizobium sp. TaxID=1871066 RepID=UPI000FE9F7FE|nr:hypothetical protein [Mesorhizobium sp.]RWB39721.1 MAG: hypothetical protein EOQ46_26125 [Mesorhizobium sp.]
MQRYVLFAIATFHGLGIPKHFQNLFPERLPLGSFRRRHVYRDCRIRSQNVGSHLNDAASDLGGIAVIYTESVILPDYHNGAFTAPVCASFLIGRTSVGVVQ